MACSKYAVLAFAALWLVACGDDPDPTDAGVDAGGDGGTEIDDAGGEDAGASDSGAPDAGEPPIEPQVVIDSRCGLDFRWLDPDTVGRLVSYETPHDELDVGEASVLEIALLSEGILLNREPTYSTRLHRMVYTTQDRGVEREATAMVILPEVDSSMTMPVILWHHGTTGANDQCAPSFNIEDTSSEQFAVAAILSLLSSYGYIIVAPDYLGQKSVGDPSPALHPYLIVEPTAIASLDAVDAARELAAMRTAPTFGRIALYGASQGGHAAFASALYAPYYAPDLDIGVGVYTIAPSDLSRHMARGINSLSPPSGNVALWLVGADAWYEPEMGLSNAFLSPFDVQTPTAVAMDCSPDIFDSVTNTDQVFSEDLRTAAASGWIVGLSPWQCYARENSITRTRIPPPSFPGLVVNAADDVLVDTAIERGAFGELCDLGHDLAYLECTGAGHGEGFFYSIDDALDFIDAQLSSPTTQACMLRTQEQCSSDF